MSTHNICFHGEIREIFFWYPSYMELCRYVIVVDEENRVPVTKTSWRTNCIFLVIMLGDDCSVIRVVFILFWRNLEEF